MSKHTHWRDCQAWGETGLPFTTTSNEACRLFDATLTQYVGWYDEPTLGGIEVTLNKLMAADYNNIMAHVISNGLELMGTGLNPRLDQNFQKKMDTLSQLADSNNISNWEKKHVKAIDLCGKGFMSSACDVWEDILVEYPQDILALKFAHDSYFYLGYQPQMRDSIARVMPHWKVSTPLYSYLYGMYSFGLCETNLYSEAEAAARKGLELNARDAWSTHSMAHVLEMGGRHEEGIAFMSKTVDDWSYCGMLASHNFWHWAVYHIEKGEHEAALDIFDAEVTPRAEKSGSMLDIVDACSMLYRLEMEGVHIGDRWGRVYELCRPHVDDHLLVFNDVHLLMSYMGAKKKDMVNTLMESLHTYVNDCIGTNHTITKQVGLALCEALVAYDDGRFDKAVEILHPLRYKIITIGGSNAQRDVFNQFLINAAIKSTKSEHHKLARSLLVERKELKEHAPLTDRLIAKAIAH